MVARSLQLSDANHTLDVMGRDAGRRQEDRRQLTDSIAVREHQLQDMADIDIRDAEEEKAFADQA